MNVSEINSLWRNPERIYARGWHSEIPYIDRSRVAALAVLQADWIKNAQVEYKF